MLAGHIYPTTRTRPTTATAAIIELMGYSSRKAGVKLKKVKAE